MIIISILQKLFDNVSLLTNKFGYKNIGCANSTQIILGEVFGYNNIDFYIFSPIDKQIPEIIPERQDKIKIAILHEPVNDANYDNGRSISGGRFTADDLSLYDYVMLGDIHKQQFLGKNDRIAYCGSFVQKKIDESVDKGYIRWNMKKGVGVFVPIPLLEIYIKMEAIDNKCIIPDIKDNQTIRKVSLVYRDCTNEYLKDIKNNIKKKFGNKLKDTNIIVTDKNPPPIIDHISTDILPMETHQELIRKILEDDPIVDEILDEHGKNIQDANINVKTQYRLNYLYWSNIYCYGKDNFIDFTNFNQKLVMLNGKNKSGKSAVLDILTLILFNKCNRGSKDHVINENSDSGWIKVSFNVGPDEYIIEQTYFRGSNNRHFMLYINNKEYLDVTNISKNGYRETYEFLHKEVGLGNYENFINMTVATQERNSFVDMNQSELTKLLINITNIDMLENIENKLKSELTIVKSQFNWYKDELAKIPEVSDEKLNNYKKIENNLKEKRGKIENEISSMEKEINKLCGERHNIDEQLNKLCGKHHNIDEQINELYKQIRDSDEKLEKQKSLLQNDVNSYVNMSIDEINLQLGIIQGKLSKMNKDEKDHIRATDYSFYDIAEKNILKQKIDKLKEKGVYSPSPKFTFQNNINDLERIIENYKEEPLRPLEIPKIKSMKKLNPVHEPLNSLPDYESLRKDINIIKASIEKYNVNFEQIRYNKTVNHVTIINVIFVKYLILMMLMLDYLN
jgi:DNA repair exonuclease SbcCD ATPase subunit